MLKRADGFKSACCGERTREWKSTNSRRVSQKWRVCQHYRTSHLLGEDHE